MRRDWFFYSLLFAATLVAVLAVVIYVQRSSLVEEHLTDLNNLQTEQLGLFRETVGLLFTLSTLIFGAVGAILLRLLTRPDLTVLQERVGLVAFLLAALSILFGYMALDSAAWMLEKEFFNLECAPVRVPARAQAVTFGASIVALVVLFMSSTQQRQRKAPVQ